jgi:endonuclease/exonuclease/phosphatase family metal-dependent hydrolase
MRRALFRRPRPAATDLRGLMLVVALATAGAGCAHALNYLEPGGPSYETRHAPSSRPPSPGAPLRVVTFNIAYAREIGRGLEVLRTAAPLRSPDVLALEEMDAPSVDRIARELGLNSVFFPSGVHPKTKRDFGCALLSPWTLTEPRKLLLPHAARGTRLRRAATVATLVRGGERVRVYAVHLPSPLGVSPGSRHDEVRALLADAAGSPDPVVILGDFNSHGIGKDLAKAGFTWITRDVGTTSRFFFFGMSYDHVFARDLVPAPGEAAFGVVKDNRGASDHRPVWAVLVPPAHGDAPLAAAP